MWYALPSLFIDVALHYQISILSLNIPRGDNPKCSFQSQSQSQRVLLQQNHKHTWNNTETETHLGLFASYNLGLSYIAMTSLWWQPLCYFGVNFDAQAKHGNVTYEFAWCILCIIWIVNMCAKFKSINILFLLQNYETNLVKFMFVAKPSRCCKENGPNKIYITLSDVVHFYIKGQHLTHEITIRLAAIFAVEFASKINELTRRLDRCKSNVFN